MDTALIAVVAATLNVAATATLASRQANLLNRFTWLRERPALFRSALATLGGLVLFVLAYFLLFDRHGTDGYRDVAGMLNANSGVLTLVAIIIAGMTVLISVVGRESVRIEDRRVERRKLDKRVQMALDEAFHNLTHIAQVLGPKGERTVRQAPQVSFRSLEDLMRNPSVDQLHDVVLAKGSVLLRFKDFMPSMPVRNSFVPRQRSAEAGLEQKGSGANTLTVKRTSTLMVDRVMKAEEARTEEATVTTQKLAMHCLNLVDALDAHHHAAICDAVRSPLRKKVCAAMRKTRKGAHHFLSSDLEVSGRDLRASNTPLFVWANDNPTEVAGVEVYEVGQPLYDMLKVH